MTDHQLKQVVNTYFEILNKEGIPEEYVKDFNYLNGDVVVTILTGKNYSRKLKTSYVETAGDIWDGMVQDARIASSEHGIQRDWNATTQNGEGQETADSQVS